MGLDIWEHDDLLERFDSSRDESDFGQRIMFATVIQDRIVGKENLGLNLRKSVQD